MTHTEFSTGLVVLRDVAAYAGWMSFQVQIMRNKVQSNLVHEIAQMVFLVSILVEFLSWLKVP